MLTSKARSLIDSKLQSSNEAKEFMAVKIMYSDVAKQIRSQYITEDVEAKIAEVMELAKSIGVINVSMDIFESSYGMYCIDVAGEQRSFAFVSGSGHAERHLVPKSELVSVKSGSDLHLKIVEIDKLNNLAKSKFDSYHSRLKLLASEASSLKELKKLLS